MHFHRASPSQTRWKTRFAVTRKSSEAAAAIEGLASISPPSLHVRNNQSAGPQRGPGGEQEGRSVDGWSFYAQ